MSELLRRGAKILVIALLGSASHAIAAESKCMVATKGDSPVAKACAHGGRDEAKRVMKGLVKDAKRNGGKYSCDDCHKSVDNGDFELKQNARDDFKKLLQVAGATQGSPQK
jgi:hypothetical protein